MSSKLRRRAAGAWLVFLLLAAAAPGRALDALVTKRVVRVPSFPLAGGHVLPEVELGVETCGRLAPTRDNVVLICHYLAGDSHAAGRYDRADPAPGWWDELIGPGLPIDTDRWFVVSTDLLCNMRVKDPRVVATGPASIDPRTGRRYGDRFPQVTVRDQVRAQRAVLDALGVRRLRAVVGPSLGGMVAWQWAVEFPDYLDLIVPVAAPVTFSAAERAGMSSAALAITSDPAWLGGEYAAFGVEPVAGVAMALYGLSELTAGRVLTFWWGLPTYVRRAREYEAACYLRLIQLHLGWDLGAELGSRAAALRLMRARAVVVGFDDDEFVTPDELRDAAAELGPAGVRSELVLLPGGHGHLSALEELPQLGPVLRRALAAP